jgi:hypothetical protein
MVTSNDNFENYLSKVQRVNLNDGLYSRKNLKMLNNAEVEINNINITKWVAEGEALMAEEEKLQKKTIVKETKKLESKLDPKSPNPYLRARCEILLKYPEEKRKLIELMEKGEKSKDHRYDAFVKDVTTLGDKMSA